MYAAELKELVSFTGLEHPLSFPVGCSSDTFRDRCSVRSRDPVPVCGWTGIAVDIVIHRFLSFAVYVVLTLERCMRVLGLVTMERRDLIG